MTSLITNPSRHRAQIVAEAIVSAYIHEIASRVAASASSSATRLRIAFRHAG